MTVVFELYSSSAEKVVFCVFFS